MSDFQSTHIAFVIGEIEIKRGQKAEKAERLEYERLKAKFGGR